MQVFDSNLPRRSEATITMHCSPTHCIMLKVRCTHLSSTVYSLSVLNRAASLASIMMYVFPVVLSEEQNTEIKLRHVFSHLFSHLTVTMSVHSAYSKRLYSILAMFVVVQTTKEQSGAI